MGKLDSYKKANPEVFEAKKSGNTGTKTPVMNMLLKISSYEIGGSLDTNFVLGKRMDTGEQVKVRLIEIEQKGKYKRVEIADFNNARHKRHVGAGNYMVLEQAIEESEGVFNSRWAATLDRDPKNTKAFVMLASLHHSVRGSNDSKKEWFRIKLLYPSQPTVVTTIEELDAALSASLTPKTPGSNPEAVIRITDDEGEKEIITVYPKRAEIEEDGQKFTRVVANPLDSVENFKKMESAKYQMIVSFLGDADIKIEIIGSTVLFPGSATKEKLETQHEASKKYLVESFYVKAGGDADGVQPAQPGDPEVPENENENGENAPKKVVYPEVGYHFCVVGTRSYADGTPYLTYIKPLHEYSEASSIKDIELFTLKK